jgi:hypothetical protein
MKYHPPFGSADPDAPYVDKNVPGAVRGSAVPAAAIEIPQREMVDFITKSGLTPTDDNYQLAQAVQSGKVNYAAADGTANALTASLSPAPASLTVGMSLVLLISTPNTDAVTINLNGTGAIPARTIKGTALSAGDLRPGPMEFIYSGSAWILTGVSLSQLQKASVGQQQTFFANGTFTVPDGVYTLLVSLVGGGGGGARGGATYALSGGGGGAGGYAEKFIATTPGTSYAVTVGLKGTRGDVVGGTGGTSSFGSEVSATGGSGGQGNTGACPGGAGGVGVGGTLNIKGGGGGDGNGNTHTVQGGHGGASFFGGGGQTAASGAGDGCAPGSGGGGCWGVTNAFGAFGADGLVIVRW